MALTKVQDGGLNLTDAGMPAGSVLQVVQQVFPTYVQFTSTSYADTGITKAITPSSTSSKILAMISVGSTGVSEANGRPERASCRNTGRLYRTNNQIYFYESWNEVSNSNIYQFPRLLN